MLDQDDIYQRLTPIFRDVFDDDDLVVRPGLTAEDVKGWNSLSNVHLMMSVERAFKIRLAAAQIADLRNVGDLVQLIAARAAA